MPNSTPTIEDLDVGIFDLDVGIFDLDIQIQEATTAFPEPQMTGYTCITCTCD